MHYADLLGMREVWKQVVGYEGVYEVSDQGRVKRIVKSKGSCVGSIRNGRANPYGYWYIGLSNDGVVKNHFIHRLVAAAFIGPRESNQQVNHCDGNKGNNWVGNLEYVTPSQNQLHRCRVLKKGVGLKHYRSTLCDEDITVMRSMRDRGLTQRAISIAFGVSQSTVSSILLNQTWRSNVNVKRFPGRIKISDRQIDELRKLRSEGKSQFWIARHFNLNQSQVSRILSGQRRGLEGVK